MVKWWEICLSTNIHWNRKNDKIEALTWINFAQKYGLPLLTDFPLPPHCWWLFTYTCPIIRTAFSPFKLCYNRYCLMRAKMEIEGLVATHTAINVAYCIYIFFKHSGKRNINCKDEEYTSYGCQLISIHNQFQLISTNYNQSPFT